MARPTADEQQFEYAMALARIVADDIRKEKCEKKLREFLKHAWPVIEPSAPMVGGWHIDAICEHLQAVEEGEIRKLIINIAPRSSKSTQCAIAFPAWTWIRNPGKTFLFASYDLKLSMRDSRKCRMLIGSDWYQKRWGDRFRILTNKGGQDTKQRFDNDRGGARIATSTDAGTTGEGGNISVLDDPNDIGQMNSPAYVESVIYYYEHVLATRAKDPKTDARIVIQQRCGENDLTGHILEKEHGWEYLVIPMEYEGSKSVTSIGWSDPRTVDGELMCPERFGPEELAEHKKKPMLWCTPGFTPILMSDWSEKRIESIKVGDEVIGFEVGSVKHKKATLRCATVTDISHGYRPVYRVLMASGREAYCTIDHKWYRRKKDSQHKLYLPARVGCELHSVYTPPSPVSQEDQRLYDWLGGLMDGEGSCETRGQMTLSQSDRNPEVQAEINRVLHRLGFEFSFWSGNRKTEIENPKWAKRGHWNINGGRAAKIKLLTHAHMAKKERFVRSLWLSADRLTTSVKGQIRHKVISITPAGEMPVYGLTTTTGNYVAWGFASQNSGQFQQRPAPGEGARFKRQWWKFWNEQGTKTGPVRIKVPGGDMIEKEPVELPVAFEQVVQGWDMSFGTISDSASMVAGHAWGRVGANVYLLSRSAEQRDFPDTLKSVREMSRHFPCPEKMVESKANGPAVIQTLRNEIPGMIPSPITGGLESLANSMTGYVEAGNVVLPNPDLYPWVWDLIEQFSVFPNGKHDDDVAAASHAWLRLFDSVANAAAPEFRVTPRVGEPASACHIKPDEEIRKEIPAHWRRWIGVAPGAIGAALWFCETPKGSLRVYRELELQGVDAYEAGRLIAEATLPDIRAYQSAVHLAAKWNIALLLEKECFAPIEPVGSYAELLEEGILGYEPLAGEWEYQEQVKRELRLAKFTSEMCEFEQSTWDRLRDLLRFAPPEFKELDYDRTLAIELSRTDTDAYHRYMAAVEGKVAGEWPKIKFAASCKNVAAAIGSARRTEDVTDPFVRALLVGISAPPSPASPKPIREVLWTPKVERQHRRAQRMLRRAI